MYAMAVHFLIDIFLAFSCMNISSFLPLSIIPSLSLMMMIVMAASTSVLSQENRVCCFEVLLPFSSFCSRMHNTNFMELNNDVCIGM